MESELVNLFNQKLVIPQGKNINSLPNEMLRTILTKLEVQELFGIRGVCRRWMAVFEDYCREARSILIGKSDKNINISELNQQFNGFVDFNTNCVVLKVKSVNNLTAISLSNGLTKLLARLFPRIEHIELNSYLYRKGGTTENFLFLLDHWSSSIVTLHLPHSIFFSESHHSALCEQIDKLTSLKRLYFSGESLISPTILSRLDHCTVGIYEMHSAVAHLGPNCTSLCLLDHLSLDDITQLDTINAQLVKGITALSLSTREPEVLSFICANLESLHMLNLSFSEKQNFNADLIGQLARLSNLSQLSLGRIDIDLATLDRSNLSFLYSVQSLSMSYFEFSDGGNQFDGDQFCRLLESIFPNLTQLTINHRDPLVRLGIAQNLHHFIHLRKYNI